jgi:hypothetical protein
MHMDLSNREYLGRFSEENRKFNQDFNGHPRKRRPISKTGETEDHDLVFTGKKPTQVRGGC